MDTWNAYTFCLLWIMSLWTFICKSSCEHMFSFLLGRCLGVELLDCLVALCWIFKETVAKMATLFMFPPIMYEGSHFSTFSSTLVILFYIVAILVGVGWYPSMVLAWRFKNLFPVPSRPSPFPRESPIQGIHIRVSLPSWLSQCNFYVYFYGKYYCHIIVIFPNSCLSGRGSLCWVVTRTGASTERKCTV